MKEFEIWMEGYRATGERGTAGMIGKGTGETFDDAVEDFMSKNPDFGVYKNTRSNYRSESAFSSRDSNWRVWGCNLYDNEADARKAFG